MKVKKSIAVATLTLILGQSAGADCGQLWIDSQTFEGDPKTPTAQYFKGVVSGWVAYDMMLNRPRIDWDNAAENSNADFANAVREYLDKVSDHADLTKYSAGECIHYAFHHFYGPNS